MNNLRDNPETLYYNQIKNREFSGQFLHELRQYLNNPTSSLQRVLDNFSEESFPRDFYGVAIILYQPGKGRIRSFATNNTPREDVSNAIRGLLRNKRFSNFDIANENECRIQIEIILDEPSPVLFESLTENIVSENRFEMGVDGLLGKYGGKRRYLLSNDPFMRSILSIKQLKHFYEKQFGKQKFSKIEFYRFRSIGYVSYKKRWLPLYRGYPILNEPEKLSKKDLETAVSESIKHVSKFQKEDGRFRYYYNAAKDSYRDHEHIKRASSNQYYNILRHSGGALLMLYDYRLNRTSDNITRVEKSIDFLVDNIKVYKTINNIDAGYVYYNKKAKLGGTGIALYLLCEYQRLTQSDKYSRYAGLLKNHLLEEIQQSGEFRYYHLYLDKKVDFSENDNFFSFYYPGEAVIGLATYYYTIADSTEKVSLKIKIEKSLGFLLLKRPELYSELYRTLPSDSWLMMGINELWDISELRKTYYANFVFSDADRMINHMYNEKSALYPDYIGAFYYNYGNYPYADGARAEGLMAALDLAIKMKDIEKVKKYFEALKKVAWATLHLCNTEESVYAVPNPDKAIGGIRFKHTRQWFRIDTIQHVAAFYIKLLEKWDMAEKMLR